MSDYLYGRKYRVLVADKNNVALDVSNLWCTFRVERVALQVANYAEINIFNLSAGTEGTIINEGVRVVLEAGYQGFTEGKFGTEAKQYGQIFDGQIIQTLRCKEDNNVDLKLTLICLDGDSFLNKNIIKMTVNAGMNQRKIINQIASQAKIPTDIGRISPELSAKNLPRGKVFFGMPKDYLRDIAKDNGANFWVDENMIYITKPTDIPPGQALVLTPKTGLIGTPQQTQEGVQFKCLLNPSLKLMGMVKLDLS